MKTTFLAVAIILTVLLAAVITKPSDDECLAQVKDKVNEGIYNSNGNILVKGLVSTVTEHGITRYMLRIEDKIFYKDIYLKINNQKIGTGWFGTVSMAKIDNSSFSNTTSDYNNNAQTTNSYFPKKHHKILNTENSNYNPSNNNQTSNSELENAKNDLQNALVELERIKRFHIGRLKSEKDNQIYQQEQYIESLREKIQRLETQ
jgi:hypothetical protein